jgi:hypothetical protein
VYEDAGRMNEVERARGVAELRRVHMVATPACVTLPDRH